MPALSPRRGALAAKRFTIARRMAWTLLDQVISSGTNFVLAIVVARSVSLRDFGGFSIAFATYLLFAALVRAATTEPLLLRFSTAPDNDRRDASRDAMGTVVVAAVFLSVVAVAVGALLGPPLRSTMLALAGVLPFLLVQEGWRFVFFADGRPARAAFNDFVWSVGQLLAVGVVVSTARSSPATLVLAWGSGAAIASFVGFGQARLVPRPSGLRAWITLQRDLAGRFFADASAMYGSRQSVNYLIGGLAGLSALGQFRAAEAVLGPVNVVIMASYLIGVPEGARLLAKEPGRLRAYVLAGGCALLTLVNLWGLAVASLPDRWGAAILGPAWVSAKEVLVPLTWALAASAMSTAFNVGMRVLGAVQEALRARFVLAAAVVVGGAAGAYTGSARGAAIGVGIASWAGVLIYGRNFLRAYGANRVFRTLDAADDLGTRA